MKLLLDSNALLWALVEPARLAPVRDLLEGPNQIFTSAVSWWEIAIKISIGKLDADYDVLYQFALDSGMLMLPLHSHAVQTLFTLPPLHKDPFDRMLLAQAISASMQIVTGDKIFAKYSDLAIII